MPLSWELFVVILVTAGVVAIFTVFCLFVLLVDNSVKYRWDGQILVSTDTKRQEWVQKFDQTHRMTLPADAELTAIRLCGARPGRLPLVHVERFWESAACLPFLFDADQNTHSTDIVFLTPIRGSEGQVTIQVYNTLRDNGRPDVPIEFHIQWEHVSVLA